MTSKKSFFIDDLLTPDSSESRATDKPEFPTTSDGGLDIFQILSLFQQQLKSGPYESIPNPIHTMDVSPPCEGNATFKSRRKEKKYRPISAKLKVIRSDPISDTEDIDILSYSPLPTPPKAKTPEPDTPNETFEDEHNLDARDSSPLSALLMMTQSSFKKDPPHDDTDGKVSVVSSSEKIKERRQSCSIERVKVGTHRKRRKARTAFSNFQICQLERRFLFQKYLTPADRDELANGLGLSNAQVITWFQNRRAKLKRDLDEIRADVAMAGVCC